MLVSQRKILVLKLSSALAETRFETFNLRVSVQSSSQVCLATVAEFVVFAMIMFMTMLMDMAIMDGHDYDEGYGNPGQS